MLAESDAVALRFGSDGGLCGVVWCARLQAAQVGYSRHASHKLVASANAALEKSRHRLKSQRFVWLSVSRCPF
jgi:hypothetical protein